MKTLKYIQLKSFDGKALNDENGKLIDFKTAILTHIGAYPARNGADAMRAFALGLKVHNSGADSVELEDAEMELLNQIVGEHPRFTTIVMGQLFPALNNAKDGKAKE